MAAAGLFKMLVPRSLGGGEVDPATLLRVISEVARADGSAGWCVFVSTLGVAAGTLREDVAQEIWGHDPNAYVAGSAAGAAQWREAPPNRAGAVAGGDPATRRG